jgi:hypothetical protein
MTKQEFLRLRSFWYTKRNAPYTKIQGRTYTKDRAAGVGQVLRSSFIKSNVHLEKVFIQYK